MCYFILAWRQQPYSEISHRITGPGRIKQGVQKHRGTDLETRQADSQKHHRERQRIRIYRKQFLSQHNRQLRLFRR